MHTSLGFSTRVSSAPFLTSTRSFARLAMTAVALSTDFSERDSKSAVARVIETVETLSTEAVLRPALAALMAGAART